MKQHHFYISALCFLISCNYIPCSSTSDLDVVKDIPERVQMTGTYIPDSFTKRDIEGFAASEIIYLQLNEEGEILMKNLPKNIFTSHVPDSSFRIDGYGKWFCKNSSGHTEIKTNIKLSDTTLIAPVRLKLYKKSGKFMILWEFGNPDICTAIRLIQN